MFYRPLGVSEFQSFERALEAIIQTHGADHVFIADNLITIDRHLGFVDDPDFMEAFRAEANTRPYQALIWRLHTLCWAAKQALRLDGDFVECGVYEGFSSAVVSRYLKFDKLERLLWLYDLFDHEQESSGILMPAHSAGLHGRVVERFSALPNVRVVKGLLPESFAQGAPDRIAWLHLDLNSAEAETRTLEFLFDRITPGGLLILDDYGWRPYGQQKEAADIFAQSKGYGILELPTGQGLLIKT